PDTPANLGGVSETTSETHIEFAQPRFHDPTRLADRFRDLILAVTESGKHVVARFEQRLQALHFGVHGESDAAYGAPETVRARASATERQRVVALRGRGGLRPPRPDGSADRRLSRDESSWLRRNRNWTH